VDMERLDRMLHFLETITQFFVNFMSREMVLYKNWEWTKRLPVVNGAWLRAKRDMDEYYEFIKAEVDGQIQLYEASPPGSSHSNTFVHAYLDEMHSTGNPWLHIDQLYCVVSDFWLAGMETTATLLRWAILYVVEFGETQKRAQEEIDRVVGRDRFVASEDRARMPYTSALILESERYSVLGTTLFRVCDSEQKIADYDIPPHTDYMFHVYSDNTHYTGAEHDPTEFQPERYLHRDESAPDGVLLWKDAAERFTAFGMGKRKCPGEGLARMEVFLILTTLLQHYDFTVPEGSDRVDMSYQYGLIIYPTRQPVGIVKRL